MSSMRVMVQSVINVLFRFSIASIVSALYSALSCHEYGLDTNETGNSLELELGSVPSPLFLLSQMGLEVRDNYRVPKMSKLL